MSHAVIATESPRFQVAMCPDIQAMILAYDGTAGDAVAGCRIVEIDGALQFEGRDDAGEPVLSAAIEREALDFLNSGGDTPLTSVPITLVAMDGWCVRRMVPLTCLIVAGHPQVRSA